jgi:hypothetical protein
VATATITARAPGRVSSRRSRRRRPAPTPLERYAVVAVSVASLAGVLADGVSPTGSLVGDVLAAASFTVAVVAASSVAGSWAWVAGAGIVAVFSDDDVLVYAGALLVLVIVASNVEAGQRRALGAVIGGGILNVAVRLPTDTPTGTSAAIAAAAVLPLLVGGWLLARSSSRRVVVRLGSVAAGVVVVGSGLLALAGVAARGSVERGVDQAEAGLAAARRGDTAEAAERLLAAERSFASAERTVGAWWMAPARLVPLVGHQASALDEAVAVGRRVADAGAESAGSADLEAVRLVRGRVDLDAVEALRPPLLRLDQTLRSARAALADGDSPWLVSPIADRLDRLRREVVDGAEDAELARLGIDAVPALLGRDQPAHYLVLFASAAESRAMGGFISAYAEVVFDRGSMTLARSGKITDLNEAGEGRAFTDPDVFPLRYLSRGPETHWQQISGTADLPTVAEASRQLWPQSGGDALAGVVFVDTAGLAALLELTGPVEVPGTGRVLAADTASDYLLRALYDDFPVDEERDAFVERVLVAVVDAVRARSLPGPEGLGEALAPATDRGQLLVHSFDRDAAELLARLGIDGALPPLDGGDFFSLRWDNYGANKIDAYLERAITYDATYDPGTGAVEADVRIDLRNLAPATGLPPIVIGNILREPVGTNLAQLAVHSPLQLVDARVDGSAAPVNTNEEYGRFVHGVNVQVPPGGTVTVELTLRGRIDADPAYRLRVSEGAAALPASMTVRVRGADGSPSGAVLVDGTPTLGAFLPDAVTDVRAELDREG